MLHPVFKLAISLDHHAQHVFNERKIVVLVLVPALRTLLQGLVIRFLALFNQHLDTDVFAHDKPGAVEQQKRKEATHAAVPVVERMDAEKVQDEHRHQEERVVGTDFDGLVEARA